MTPPHVRDAEAEWDAKRIMSMAKRERERVYDAAVLRIVESYLAALATIDDLREKHRVAMSVRADARRWQGWRSAFQSPDDLDALADRLLGEARDG